LSLRDQHAVERILVCARQLSGPNSVIDRNRKLIEPFPKDPRL
jgi:hypothetical protein